jgi:hypothetical protein
MAISVRSAHNDAVTPRRRDVLDASTEPLALPVGFATREVRSVAEAVVTAMTQAQADSPRHFRTSRRRFRLPLILVGIVIVATSAVIAFRMDDHGATARGPATRAASGECLTWPSGEADRAVAVDCNGDHLFEVAEAVDIDAVDASGADRLQQIFEQVCPPAIDRYLGSHFDPKGRFGIGMVWSPAGPQPQSGGRLLCGLQLGNQGASGSFRGRVAELDQSAIWPAATCLGILDGNATDLPVDCASPHAMEITGVVSLADAFVGPPPGIAAQDEVVRRDCGAVTEAYLSPLSLAATSLTVRYTPISPASWAAGSRQIACRLASPDPDGRWATLVGSARTGVLINGRQPAAGSSDDPTPTPPTADGATAPAVSPVVPPQDPEPVIAADEPPPTAEPEPPAEAPVPAESPDEVAPPPALDG